MLHCCRIAARWGVTTDYFLSLKESDLKPKCTEIKFFVNIMTIFVKYIRTKNQKPRRCSYLSVHFSHAHISSGEFTKIYFQCIHKLKFKNIHPHKIYRVIWSVIRKQGKYTCSMPTFQLNLMWFRQKLTWNSNIQHKTHKTLGVSCHWCDYQWCNIQVAYVTRVRIRMKNKTTMYLWVFLRTL